MGRANLVVLLHILCLLVLWYPAVLCLMEWVCVPSFSLLFLALATLTLTRKAHKSSVSLKPSKALCLVDQHKRGRWRNVFRTTACHSACVVMRYRGHTTFFFPSGHRHPFDFAVSCSVVWLEFDAVPWPCDCPPRQITPGCSRWTRWGPVYMHASYHHPP